MAGVNDIPNGEFCENCKHMGYKTEKNYSKYGGYEGDSVVPYCGLYNCIISYYATYPLHKCFQCYDKTYLEGKEWQE